MNASERPSPDEAGALDPEAFVLNVRHRTRYDYGSPVEYAHHVVHLRPRRTVSQRIDDWRLDVTPAPERSDAAGADHRDDDGVHELHDVWGNRRHLFSHSQVHDRLDVVSSFRATMLPRPPRDAAASVAWDDCVASLGYRAGERAPDATEFTLPTRLAPRDPALRAFAADLFPAGRPVLEGAAALMHRVHVAFDYRPSTTNVDTTALQALALRRGVCQDFAHVMIGSLRSLGLAARYVSGYLLTHPPPGQPRLVGADASHAWIAVWCPKLGWAMFDPTNDVAVGSEHVTLAWGRDYADVAPVHGILRGGRRAKMSVAVTVMPASEQRIPAS